MIALRNPLLILAAFLLTFLSPVLDPSSIWRPDWTLIAVVLVAVSRPSTETLLAAAIVGAAEDALSAAPFGSRAIVLVGVAYVVGKLAHDLHLEAGRGRLMLLVSAIVVATGASRLVSWLSDTAATEINLAAVLTTVFVGALVWPLAPERRQHVRAEGGLW